MAEATAPGGPSHYLRSLIVRATDDGTQLAREAMLGFVEAVRQTKTDFAAGVEPLGLSDREYELVAQACGLKGLLDLADGLESMLSEVTATP